MDSILWKPLVLLGLLLFLVLGCTERESGEPYVIGAMDALTGVAESYGNPLLQAKLLAVEEINAGGGINGRMLELIVEDSKCAAQDAITAYNKLSSSSPHPPPVLTLPPLVTTSSAPPSTTFNLVSTLATRSGSMESAALPPSPSPQTTRRVHVTPLSRNSRDWAAP